MINWQMLAKRPLIMKNSNDVKIHEKNVLVVEDTEINIKIMNLLLTGCGINNIVIARNGQEALALFHANFDVVFLDINLPDMTGIEVCQHMRKQLQGKTLPIIACTAGNTTKAACIDAGMTDFLPKPIQMSEFQAVIQRYVLGIEEE